MGMTTNRCQVALAVSAAVFVVLMVTGRVSAAAQEPRPARLFQELHRFLGPPSAGSVRMHRRLAGLCGGGERIHEAPGVVDLVLTGEQRRVALQGVQ